MTETIQKHPTFIYPWKNNYRQVSNTRRTESQHLNDSRSVLRLFLPNPFKLDVKSIMNM